MEVGATLKHARISPQKCRLVANQIRGMKVEPAVNLLKYSNKKSAELIKKVLESAMNNAEHNEGADIDELVVSRILINKGPVLKRFRARAKGRGTQILKPTSHITVAVSDK